MLGDFGLLWTLFASVFHHSFNWGLARKLCFPSWWSSSLAELACSGSFGSESSPLVCLRACSAPSQVTQQIEVAARLCVCACRSGLVTVTALVTKAKCGPCDCTSAAIGRPTAWPEWGSTEKCSDPATITAAVPPPSWCSFLTFHLNFALSTPDFARSIRGEEFEIENCFFAFPTQGSTGFCFATGLVSVFGAGCETLGLLSGQTTISNSHGASLWSLWCVNHTTYYCFKF